MLIGLVCPYSLDGPGGVQNHVLGLARYLIEQGHDVRVIAPGTGRPDLPAYVTTTGRGYGVAYNGSVAHIQFGPLAVVRVRRWLREGRFDLLHLHEPAVPSLSLVALLATSVPAVATMHTVNPRSRAMLLSRWWLRPLLGRLRARIAVSEEARRTLTDHLGLDARVIPNGVDVDVYAGAEPMEVWAGSERRPTVALIGRLDDPRKGLAVLAAAWPRVVAALPGARLLLMGPGEGGSIGALPGVELLGSLPDAEKARLLRSVDVYVAPHIGRESFGIVLAEAMSAGAPVVASNLPAFEQVLGNGTAGVLVPVGDPAALGEAIVGLAADPRRRKLLASAARVAVERFSWNQVGSEVLDHYELALTGRSSPSGGSSVSPSASVRPCSHSQLNQDSKNSQK